MYAAITRLCTRRRIAPQAPLKQSKYTESEKEKELLQEDSGGRSRKMQNYHKLHRAKGAMHLNSTEEHILYTVNGFVKDTNGTVFLNIQLRKAFVGK
jgi:hypothetical protein